MNPIPTRERCAACHRISPIGFFVPNEIWEVVVHPSLQDSILCLSCFTSRADEKLIPWDKEILFFPVSFYTHLMLTREMELKE